MKQNVGGIDKGIRIVAGLALLAFAAFGDGSARWFGLIGVVPLLTVVFGFCPVYALIGFSTSQPKAPK
jgi:hypothetical protein